ncbi:MAG: Tm-1-like ATP-binding domain-containing protein [Anaerolineae bacterium]|nr:Tm-1-like ATP-binding domain-containing protein [Anaerolineae bacterium]
MAAYVVILGSLDTKGREVDSLRDKVRAFGGEPLVVDTGVLGEATTTPDISRHDVANAAGSSIQTLIEAGDKARALTTMAEGAIVILGALFREGRLGGVLSIGGSRGTACSTRAMQSLPVGVPKLMVSTMASGHNPFGPYVGTKDITLMHSVADVQGVNAVTRPIFTNAAAAIVAMSRVGAPVRCGDKPMFAASMLGVSTALVDEIRSRLEDEAGISGEVIAFHAVGTGGRAMEELIDSGLFDGVFDVTPGEMMALVVDGLFSAGPGRMQAAGRLGLPQVVAPGGLDFIIEGPLEETRYRGRKIMRHTPTISLVRTSVDEMEQAARLIAGRLAASTGPAAMILPLCGFGWFSRAGQPLYDPESDRAFVETFRALAPAGVQVVEMDTHLNDPAVAEMAIRLMKEMVPISPAAKITEYEEN